MEDNKIIDLYFKRDQTAICETVASYQNYCGKIAANILRSPEDQDECLNDTWLNTWNSIPPQKPKSLKAYVGRITRNLAISMIRHNSAEKRSTGAVDESLDELSDIYEASVNNIDEMIEHQALLDDINAFLSKQSAEKRIVFVRRYFYFDSILEISEKLSLKENTVKSILRRTRNELEKELKESFGGKL